MIEISTLRRLAGDFLDIYVGNQGGSRILSGQIRRGHTEAINACIWLSDMRGFTALSERLSPQRLVDLINRFFDCQTPAILKRGGEVLKFMGDGLLDFSHRRRSGANFLCLRSRARRGHRSQRDRRDPIRIIRR